MSDKISFKNNDPNGVGYINLVDVVLDDTFRCREQEDNDTLESYTEVFRKYIKANKHAEKVRYEQLQFIDNLDYPFPPVWVWQDEGLYFLIAGHHRFLSATKAKMTKILVREYRGTKEEAIKFAITDNHKNGVRLNYGDWKYCITKALILFPGKTAGAVAIELGCGRSNAYKIQKELSTSGQLHNVEERIGADGRKRSVKRNSKQPDLTPFEESGSTPICNQQVDGIVRTQSKLVGDPAYNVEEQPRCFDELLNDLLVLLDEFFEEHPLQDERVRFVDSVSAWAYTMKATLSKLQE